MASTYCKVDFNWKSDSDENITVAKTVNVVKYSFIDIGSSDFDNISYENRNNSHETCSLRYLKQQSAESFIAEIACNNPKFSQIDGLSIESESRTLEISNDKDGYITTVRGRKLVHESDGVDDRDHFICSCSFEKPHSVLSIKFLSLGKRETVSIHSISINIRQHDLDPRASRANNTFDMAKLKKDVEEMGDSVSVKALDFLATMETFEKNKMNSLGGMFTPDAMTAMQSPLAQNGISSIMRSVLGDKTMSDLEENVPKNGGSASTEQDSIYSMLQAVCGKVAETRKPKKPTEEISPASAIVVDPGDSGASGNTGSGQLEGFNNNMLLGIVNQKLEEAKQDMREEMHRVKEEVLASMEDMKSELTGQLNDICLLLQGLKANSMNSHCVKDA